MLKIIKYLLIVYILVMVVSCEVDSGPDNLFIGSWEVIAPHKDTIVFQNESYFTRVLYDGIRHSYDYSFGVDSITIQYKGPNMLLVQSSTHNYIFNDDELVIDFSNGCYSFGRQVYTLKRLN